MLILALICQAITSLIVIIAVASEDESNIAYGLTVAILFGIPLAYLITQLLN